MRRAAIIIATVATLAIAACGDDDSDTSATSTTTTTPAVAAADPNRYCALTRELDAEGESFFADLGEDATPEEYEAAERRFVTRFAGKLEELEQAAPQEIKSDVAVLLAGQRQRAGLPSSTRVDESDGSVAERRIRAWEKRSCER